MTDERLLVGPDTSDDAAVYKITDDLALILTIDFFTPVVDDPYLFGQIAAANALSDIYAMGGRPFLALNIACLPACLSPEEAAAIIRGGADKVIEAGAVIGGGHTVMDEEPKYGLAVAGFVHPAEMLTNAGARPGDLLVLTKPLGTGIAVTAYKGGLAEEELVEAAVKEMRTLNSAAAACAAKHGARACTDITGFGFLGHAAEMAAASGVTLEIFSSRVPLLPGVLDLADMGLLPAGAYENRRFLEGKVDFGEGVLRALQDVLFDPQTSGGLLVAAAPGQAEKMLEEMRAAGLTAAVVGRVLPAEGRAIVVL